MSERRSFFRIGETIALECKLIDTNAAQSGHPEAFFNNSHSLKLYSELKKIDSENTQYLHEIKEVSRPLAEYLHNLNRKLELLGQEVMNEQIPQPPSKTIKQVNLSEGGISFGSTNAIETSQFIALHMVFLPSHAGLAVFGKVIRCEPAPNGEFQIAASFHNIHETQQQLIGQHIMRAQMAEKRRQQNL